MDKSWVPASAASLIVGAFALPLGSLLPERLQSASITLMTLAFAGLAITANAVAAAGAAVERAELTRRD